MTPLRQRLIEEIALRGYSDKTKEAYVHAVACLAQHDRRPPDGLSDEELRAYLLHLHRDSPKAASTLNVAVSGLRFFYQRVLPRPFTHLERNLPRPRQAKRRPKAYTVAEVKRLLDLGCRTPKHRAFLMTVYGAGLRLNEACHLRPEHSDRSAGQIRVEQGKGRKDRYTVLPNRLLGELEAYWRMYRPQGGWLSPSMRNPQAPMPDGTGQKVFYQAVVRAGLPDKGGIPCLRHSFATHWMEAGRPLFVLKRLLGHTSLSTTSKYLHVSREHLAQIKSPLDQSDWVSATETLLAFGRNNLGAQLGVTAVLHTWSQTLLDHYHLHGIVTGGGPARDGRRWVHSRPDYLFHVGALSPVFRAKFCEGLQRLYTGGKLQFHGQLEPLGVEQEFQKLMREATRKGWVVYSKRPFAGPEPVLAYLSRYTHRVGISNRRLLQLDRSAGTVTFDYKAYADGARHKPMQLGREEFIRRLRLHFLPPHFVKIRHCGLLANRGRQQRLERARALLNPGQPAAPAPAPTPRSLPVCPHCGWAALFLVQVVPPQRFQPTPALTDSS